MPKRSSQPTLPRGTLWQDSIAFSIFGDWQKQGKETLLRIMRAFAKYSLKLPVAGLSNRRFFKQRRIDMLKYERKKLNLSRLLSMGKLDIRGVVAANPDMTANEYFQAVEWLIEDAQRYIEALAHASDTYKIERLKDALNKIGHADLDADLVALLDALKAGRTVQAKKWGAMIAPDFAALYDSLKHAYKARSRRYAQVRMERFVSEKARYLDIIRRAADTDGLREIKDGLTELGFEKLNPEIDGLIALIESGQKNEAINSGADLAKRVDLYCEQLSDIYASLDQGSAQQPSQADVPVTDRSLADVLEYLDFEEAHRKLRVLAVDDVLAVLNSVTSILSPYYEVYALTKATQVESFLKHTVPELFLLDIEMPELSGYDLVSVIRSFKEHKDTPIIFLTGGATRQNIRTAVSLGVSDFMAKPINNEILLNKIESQIVWKKAF